MAGKIYVNPATVGTSPCTRMLELPENIPGIQKSGSSKEELKEVTF